MSSQQRNKPHLIGLSLSACVRDLLRRRVAYYQVTKIVTGTAAPTDEIWAHLMDLYEFQWSMSGPDHEKSAKRGIALANRLRAEGKIEQPRLTIGKAPRWHGKPWVHNEMDITWWDLDYSDQD